MKRRLVGVAAAVLGTVLISGAGLQTVSAADPVPTTVTLPLFGAPLTLGITTGPGGALTEVTVDPADNTVATQLKPHKVVFQSSNPADPTADPAKVVVKSKNGTQSVSARAGSLADVSGPGSWSGDIFGTGTATTVNFTIAAAADGSPDITGITSSDATAVIGDVKHSTEDDDEGTEMSASVSIKFLNAAGDQSRTLKIKVKVEDEEGTTEAKLSISLGRMKGVAIDAALAAGPHTWTNTLCDGTTATINYTVAEDGSVSGVTVDPASAELRVDTSKIEARFETGERVKIRVRAEDGLIRIDIKERFRCDSPNPTTNVSTSIPADDDNNDEGHHDGHGHDDDDNTTTTAAP